MIVICRRERKWRRTRKEAEGRGEVKKRREEEEEIEKRVMNRNVIKLKSRTDREKEIRKRKRAILNFVPFLCTLAQHEEQVEIQELCRESMPQMEQKKRWLERKRKRERDYSVSKHNTSLHTHIMIYTVIYIHCILPPLHLLYHHWIWPRSVSLPASWFSGNL